MRLYIITLLIIIFSLQGTNGTVIPHLGKPVPQNLPKVTLQLDLLPEQRWVSIARQFIVPLQTAVAAFQFFFDTIPYSDLYFQAFGYWADNYYQYTEMVRELKGVCKGADLPFPQVMLLNFLYEFTTIKACSGILVRNDQNQILHGRNLDFVLWNRLSKLLAEVEVYNGQTYVTTMISLVGSAFALTGSKPYHFGLNEDTRKSKNDHQTFSDVIDNLLIKQYMPSAWLLRQVLIQETTWTAARQRLMETNVTAPIYYILSGLGDNEGCVIEKSSVGVHAVYDLSNTTWFLVQSNYDRDQPDPWHDPRRAPVERKINKLGHNMTIQVLFDKIMSSWPTFNIASILTMTTIPKTGYINATSWYGITA